MWAKIQNLLGAAYLGAAYIQRIKGEKSENIETAIACFRETLKVLAVDAFPYAWAITQMQLGNAYSKRIRGEKANNLEAAITCYRETLKVFTPDSFPTDWAQTKDGLGNA
jgi:hypothetical protein